MAHKHQENHNDPLPGHLPAEGSESILESISDGVFTVGSDWRITFFNRAAEEITGIPREEALGRPCSEVFRASMCEADCALRQTQETGQPVINRSAYIIDADGQTIPISVSTALLRNRAGEVIGGAETFRDLTMVEELRKELEGRREAGDMVSRSPLMRRLFDLLPQVASSESTVLIQGETGTGKELLARAIHSLSRRADGPFVAINCGALPDTLLESELFGYRAGAFTGATKDKPGRFELARGGTLLLDEIGDISPAMQVRLLRVIQERVYEPLGGTSSVEADVRILAATHRDLREQVHQGTFREDLFYRIHVVAIEIPPLRDRKEDIPLLADHILTRLAILQGVSRRSISPEAIALLMTHNYPGNVRELENILEYASVLCGPDGLIQPACLPDTLHGPARTAASPLAMTAALHNLEAQVILDAIQRNHGNRQAAARELGMHKSTLYRKAKALGLTLPDSGQDPDLR